MSATTTTLAAPSTAVTTGSEIPLQKLPHVVELTLDVDNDNRSLHTLSTTNSCSAYPDGYQRYVVVIGSFLACFTLFGIMNAIGAIESYIQSNQLVNDSVSAVSWVFSIYMFFSLFLGLLVGPLYDKFGAFYLLLTGSILTFVGLFAAGSATNIYQFILSFGVCTGVGTAFMLFPAISAVSSWFDRRSRSFYIGVAQTGGSLGGIFFPILLRHLFEKYGFTWAMRIFALFNLGVTLVATLLCKDRVTQLQSSSPASKTKFDPKLFTNMKFVSLTAALFMNEFTLLIVLTYLADYAISNGASSSQAYFMITILNVSGTFGKFIPSYIAQHTGPFAMITLMSAIMTVSVLVIWLPFGSHNGVLYTFIVLFGFAYAATYSLTGATVSAITLKTRDFGTCYGTAYAVVSIGNLVSLPIAGALVVRERGGYDRMVKLVAGGSVLGTVLFAWAWWCANRNVDVEDVES